MILAFELNRKYRCKKSVIMVIVISVFKCYLGTLVLNTR